MSNRNMRRVRKAIARRASRAADCRCSIAVPRPLVVAYEGQLGIAIISGELLGPMVPPLYGPCMVNADGSFGALDLEMFTPFAADLRETLHFCFSPDFSVVGLLAVCDLLPPDLSSVSPVDLGAFDLGLAMSGPLTDVQRASLSNARFLCAVGSGLAQGLAGQRVQ